MLIERNTAYFTFGKPFNAQSRTGFFGCSLSSKLTVYVIFTATIAQIQGAAPASDSRAQP